MNQEKKKYMKIIMSILVIVLSYFGIDLVGDNTQGEVVNQTDQSLTKPIDSTNEQHSSQHSSDIDSEGHYTDAQNVKDFIEAFNELPDNYLTKDEAYDLGWEPQKGNLHDVAPGMSIGGDYFGNFENQLPEADGRDYYEADINYDGGHRGAERLVFSNDGLYFYTDDHYETFVELE